MEQHERESICKLGEEFLIVRKEFQNSSNAREGTQKSMTSCGKTRKHIFYLQKTSEQDEMIDMKKTKKWLSSRLTAHVEGYVGAVQDHELNTKETKRRRERDMQKKRTVDTKCRVCDQKGESVYHLVCSCWALAPSIYLKVRHNQITRILYQEVIQSDHIVSNPLEVTLKEPS